MAQSSQGPSGAPGGLLVLLAIAAGGLYFLGEPLQSTRPKESATSLISTTAEETVEARLWQDPLRVVRDDWNGLVNYVLAKKSLPPALTAPPTVRNMRSMVQNRLTAPLSSAKNSHKLLVLAVLVNGGPYANDVENRRRHRYALMSALTGNNYVPESPEKIGYFVAPQFPTPTHRAAPDACATDSGDVLCPLPEPLALIGFEWFKMSVKREHVDSEYSEEGAESDDLHWPRVLVLWLNSRDFASYPLRHIDSLMNSLSTKLPGSAAGKEAEVGFALIGPPNSQVLSNMYRYAIDKSQAGEEAERNFLSRLDKFPCDSRQLLLRLVTPGTPENIGCEYNEANTAYARQDHLHIYSPRSTVPLYFLVSEITGVTGSRSRGKTNTGNHVGADDRKQDTSNECKKVENEDDREDDAHKDPDDDIKYSDVGIKDTLGVAGFRSMLARDDYVLEEIVAELCQRGLECPKSKHESPIAIVSELDSEYGRAMHFILERKIKENLGCPYIEIPTFGYLRGVDGELPASGGGSALTAVADESRARNRGPLRLFFPVFEPAVGPAQVDYVRRLADDVSRGHSAHVDAPASDHSGRLRKKPYHAIGVFGSDVYDKQLILHALRERLPHVRLFTTDLDARLTDPDEYRWNRNLIVGSAHGLSLDQHKDFEVPPFRDSYQTAFFNAVQEALEMSSTHGQSADAHDQPHPPQLFEIGRRGAIDITNCNRSEQPCGWLRHAGSDLWQAARIFALLSPLLILAMVCFIRARRLPKETMPAMHKAYSSVFCLSLAAAAVIGAALSFFYLNWWSLIRPPMSLLGLSADWMPTGTSVEAGLEPLFLFEGISAVPTLVLHLTAIVFSIAIVIIASRRIELSNAEIAIDFCLKRDIDRVDTEFKWTWKAIREHRKEISIDRWTRQIAETAKLEKQANVNEIWLRYRQLGVIAWRLRRAAPWALFWTVIVVITTLVSDPNPLLARGIHELIDTVRSITVFVVLMAVFLFTDAMRLGQAYIEALMANDIVGWKSRDGGGSENAQDGTGPENTYDGAEPENADADDKVERRWKTMRLIVEHTTFVSPLIVLPFIVVFLLLVARSTIFEAWTWTPSLIAVYAGFSAHLLFRAFLFQRAAKESRETIVDDLELHRREMCENKKERKRTELVIEEIQAIHNGAFVPWTRHPILTSIVLPSGGVGLIALLNALIS